MGPFRRDHFARVRALGPPDWARVQDAITPGETPIDARNAWFLGASLGEDVDYPCTVFLTHGEGYDSCIYIDIRSDLLRQPPTPIRVAPLSVERGGVGASDRGNLRFVVIESGHGEHQGQLRGLAVDFHRKDRDFTERLAGWVRQAEQQSAFTRSVIDALDQESASRQVKLVRPARRQYGRKKKRA